MDFNFLTAANFRLVNFVLKLAELLSYYFSSRQCR